MNAETQALLFNAVPLLVLAALYLAVGASLLPVLWRERRGTREIGYATALVFPAVGVAALLVVQTLVTREPLAGHPFAAFAGILTVALPLVAVVCNWDERNLLVTGCGARTRPSNAPLRDRELAGIDRLSHRLLDAGCQPRSPALSWTSSRSFCELDVANLALVENEGRTARILAAREQGRDNESMIGQVVSLEHELFGRRHRRARRRRLRGIRRRGVADREQAPERDRTREELCLRAHARRRGGARSRLRGVRHSRLFDQAELAFMQTLAAEAASP